jgi:hypothetical protein
MTSLSGVAPSSINPPPFVPRGWPVVEPDLLMGYVGSAMVIRIGGGLSSIGFARYLSEWIRAIDARPDDASVFAMYDIPDWPGMTAVQRKQWGEMLHSRERVLRRTTRGMVLASPSRLTRGGARALFWLAPPPYPLAVVDTPRAAFAHIAERGGDRADLAIAAYDSFVRRHWRAADYGAFPSS